MENRNKSDVFVGAWHAMPTLGRCMIDVYFKRVPLDDKPQRARRPQSILKISVFSVPSDLYL